MTLRRSSLAEAVAYGWDKFAGFESVPLSQRFFVRLSGTCPGGPPDNITIVNNIVAAAFSACPANFEKKFLSTNFRTKDPQPRHKKLNPDCQISIPASS